MGYASEGTAPPRPVNEHLDARTASTGRHAERASAALPQRRQHALNVLARPKDHWLDGRDSRRNW
jgi:hypothetical protein